MPINDSAGVGVYLIDKSQRASEAIGFRSAGAIEADRGLCGTPTLISSEADFVKVFGTPSMSKHGLATMEAYMLSQRGVPQVLTRAKDPTKPSNTNYFGLMTLSAGSGKGLEFNASMPTNAIKAPVEDNKVMLYFKGEGDYCAKDNNNVVVRFSEPLTQSAYAKPGQSLRMQVFDFDSAPHIDEDVTAEFAFNPDLSDVVGLGGDLELDGYTIGYVPEGSSSDQSVTVTAYVNGHSGTTTFDYANLKTSHVAGLFNHIEDAVKNASYENGTAIINDDWYIPFSYDYGAVADGAITQYGSYQLYSGGKKVDGAKVSGPQELNCFNLSINIIIDATVTISRTGGEAITPQHLNYSCGNVEISGNSANGYKAHFQLSTNLYLKNRNEYMFMGSHKEEDGTETVVVQDNSYWATYYSNYCMEDYTFSLSYDDFDANYVNMQADAVLAGSNYIVAKSSESFDYEYDIKKGDLLTSLKYFGGLIEPNVISAPNKSYAYSQALVSMLGDNLTRWRCLATPNLGDIMNPADFTAAVTAAGESTIGLSNIGRAASVDVFNNLTGRHGNRFIADYSQYAYRTLSGKRTAVTMAALVADLLNSHYNSGIEARPPFGYNYGQISCLSLSQQFSGAERNMLARQYKVNPVIEDGGYFIWEERTSQITDTSLSDIHCIISFIWMKYAIYDAMKGFVAEYNDQATVKRGLDVLGQLNQSFITRNYIEEGIVSADKNVIGDEVLRFDYAVRFKGVARFVDVYITAYSQTQTLAVSLSQEG